MRASVVGLSSECFRQTLGDQTDPSFCPPGSLCNASKGREQETPWLRVPMTTEHERHQPFLKFLVS